MTSPAHKDRLLALLRERSYERRHVVLASGRESDFFIDCKQTVLTAEGHALVGELMLDALAELPRCEAVAGVELGGCPLASAVSLVSHQRGRGLPALYVRKARKDHGTTKMRMKWKGFLITLCCHGPASGEWDKRTISKPFMPQRGSPYNPLGEKSGLL